MNKKLELPSLRKVNVGNPNKPKILLLADDINSTSGVGNMAREFVMGTLDKFNWVQIAAARQHMHHGKILDLSQQASEVTGVSDAYLKLYPNNGYGNPELLRMLLDIERPDVILHFTDPRFWDWLYGMKYEITHRYKIPIAYYAIWDNLPYPFWNIGCYSSCDLIMGISKQSHNIHRAVLDQYKVPNRDIDDTNTESKPNEVLLKYVPHGVSETHFKPIDQDYPDYEEFTKFEESFREQYGYGIVFFWNNRNITRKHPSDLIHAFSHFCDDNEFDHNEEPILIMHTDPQDPNGTDLIAVKRAICPNKKVLFSTNRLDRKMMNYYYNLADVTVNIASNEGFGLSSLESMMSGTPILNNVTGGLQDQMRFEDRYGAWLELDSKVPTNSKKHSNKCGEWAFPVFSKVSTVRGSLATPYILEDICDVRDIAHAMSDVYETWGVSGRKELKRIGKLGREWAISNEANMKASSMCDGIAIGINYLLANWKQPPPIELIKIEDENEIIDNGIKFYE